MQKAKLSSEELCSLVEKERTDLFADYRFSGYVVARLESDAVLAVKFFDKKEPAMEAAAAEKGHVYFPLYREWRTGATWPSVDEVYDYITY